MSRYPDRAIRQDAGLVMGCVAECLGQSRVLDRAHPWNGCEGHKLERGVGIREIPVEHASWPPTGRGSSIRGAGPAQGIEHQTGPLESGRNQGIRYQGAIAGEIGRARKSSVHDGESPVPQREDKVWKDEFPGSAALPAHAPGLTGIQVHNEDVLLLRLGQDDTARGYLRQGSDLTQLLHAAHGRGQVLDLSCQGQEHQGRSDHSRECVGGAGERKGGRSRLSGMGYRVVLSR